MSADQEMEEVEELSDDEIKRREGAMYKIGYVTEFLLCAGTNTNPLGNFCIRHKAHTFNLYVAHILFWAIAVPEASQTGVDYSVGYAAALTANADAANGKVQSGRFGSGAFPMIFMCTAVATFIWLEAVYAYATYTPPVEEKTEEEME